MDDDTKNPSQPLAHSGRMKVVAEEQNVGGDFEGESERERKAGIEELVVVEIFKRNVGPRAGTHFLRVSLRSTIHSNRITRADIDLDRYTNEADFLKEVEIGGGAIAEDQCAKYGATWDCEWVAKQARQAAVELLREIQKQ